jgi:hypothetical protein
LTYCIHRNAHLPSLYNDYLDLAIQGGNEDAMKTAVEFYRLENGDNEYSPSFTLTASMMKAAREGNEDAKEYLPSMIDDVNPDLVKKVEEYSYTL